MIHHKVLGPQSSLSVSKYCIAIVPASQIATSKDVWLAAPPLCHTTTSSTVHALPGSRRDPQPRRSSLKAPRHRPQPWKPGIPHDEHGRRGARRSQFRGPASSPLSNPYPSKSGGMAPGWGGGGGGGFDCLSHKNATLLHALYYNTLIQLAVIQRSPVLKTGTTHIPRTSQGKAHPPPGPTYQDLHQPNPNQSSTRESSHLTWPPTDPTSAKLGSARFLRSAKSFASRSNTWRHRQVCQRVYPIRVISPSNLCRIG